MKTNFTIFTLMIVLLLSSRLTAKIQEDEIWNLINGNSISMSNFPTKQVIPGRELILLEMNFSESDWMNTKEKIPTGSIIETVELISTTFALNPEFNQDKLDRIRLHQLNLLLPELFMDERTAWKRIHETGGTNVESSRNLFHGFALIVRPPASPTLIALEIKTLTEEFRSPKTEKGIKPKEEDRFEASDKKSIVPSSEKLIHATDTADYRMMIYTATGPKVSKSTYGKKKCPATESKVETYTPAASTYSWITTSFSGFSDSTVTAIFRRNKQWTEMLVVSDITGSMSPYTAQLLAWYKLNTMNGRVKNFVFFNDGDMKPDNEKVAGSTGGIYGIVASQFDSVVSEAIYAMMRGGGGDTPENNVEALEYGLTNYGDAKEVVMIADNWATPRDLAFAEEINRPVRIIVCGAAFGMNVAYLDLARKTGGSVHTMEQDLTDLGKMHAGETVSIGKFKYVLRDDGSFALISSL